MIHQILLQIIETLRKKYLLRDILKAVRVARATYCRWRKSPPKKKKHHLESHIRELCTKHHFHYGYRKISALLQREYAIRKGTPADNAIIETFHASLKCETFYLERLLRTTNEVVVQTVQAYINYDNHTRILAKLNHLSPVEYRKKMVKQEFDGDS